MHASSQEFLGIQATIQCGLTLKHVRNMTKTYSPFSNPNNPLQKALLLQTKGTPPSVAANYLADEFLARGNFISEEGI